MRHKVELPGHGVFWFDGDGPLSPTDHCDDEGNLKLFDCFLTDTYAHVFENGEIKRYNRVIGHIGDLKYLDVVTVEPPQDGCRVRPVD